MFAIAGSSHSFAALPEHVSRLGKYLIVLALGFLSYTLLKRIAEVFVGHQPAPSSHGNIVSSSSQEWRRSTVKLKQGSGFPAALFRNRVFCVKGEIVQIHVMDQNHMLTAARIKRIIQLNLGFAPSRVSGDGRNLVFLTSDPKTRFVRMDQKSEAPSKDYLLQGFKGTMVSLEYDVRGILTATKEGKVQKWFPDKTGAAEYSEDRTFAFPLLIEEVLFAKEFQNDSKARLLTAHPNGVFKIWERCRDGWTPERYAYNCNPITACLFAEDILFVARGNTIDLVTDSVSQNRFQTKHKIKDLSFDKGQLYALGPNGELTVWDFRRDEPPKRIDHFRDKLIRNFTTGVEI